QGRKVWLLPARRSIRSRSKHDGRHVVLAKSTPPLRKHRQSSRLRPRRLQRRPFQHPSLDQRRRRHQQRRFPRKNGFSENPRLRPLNPEAPAALPKGIRGPAEIGLVNRDSVCRNRPKRFLQLLANGFAFLLRRLTRNREEWTHPKHSAAERNWNFELIPT